MFTRTNPSEWNPSCGTSIFFLSPSPPFSNRRGRIFKIDTPKMNVLLFSSSVFLLLPFVLLFGLFPPCRLLLNLSTRGTPPPPFSPKVQSLALPEDSFPRGLLHSSGTTGGSRLFLSSFVRMVLVSFIMAPWNPFSSVNAAPVLPFRNCMFFAIRRGIIESKFRAIHGVGPIGEVSESFPPSFSSARCYRRRAPRSKTYLS